MNIRQAILMAADQIEKHPDLFEFSHIYVPECGAPGCVLGWIGHFYGCVDPDRTDGLTGISYVARQTVSINPDEFYDRMTEIVGNWDWTVDADVCVTGMRAYADKYHPGQLAAA